MSSYSVTDYKPIGNEKQEVLEGKVDDLTKRIEKLSGLLVKKSKKED